MLCIDEVRLEQAMGFMQKAGQVSEHMNSGLRATGDMCGG